MFIDHTVYSIDPSGAKKYPMLKTFGTALVHTKHIRNYIGKGREALGWLGVVVYWFNVFYCLCVGGDVVDDDGVEWDRN